MNSKHRGNGSGHGASRVLRLVGVDGMLDGESLRIRLGESVLIGRSRRCDLSTRRCRTFLAAAEDEQRTILGHRSFLTVSRRHVRISYLSTEHVEVWDLSRNGTYVDDRRVDRLFLELDGADGVEIRLADAERLRIKRAS